MVVTRHASSSKHRQAEATTDRPSKKQRSLESGQVSYEVSSSSSAHASATTQKAKGRCKTDTEPPLKFARPMDSRHKLGAHVSAAGGVENAIVNAHAIGANAFALFLKSQRKWSSPALKDTSISTFKARIDEYKYSVRHILPHGSYLINLGNPDREKREKSYECFLDDLYRCEQLGLELYNFHPGSTVGSATRAESISYIAQCINRAHKATQTVRVVVENMAGSGNTIGSNFTDIAAIIDQVDDKQRVGVCLDTCHMFAAGYDIRTEEGWKETLDKFENMIGLTYLCGMHINDSKTVLNSKRDRHENIGLGKIGIEAFHYILNDPRVEDIPLILETPSNEKPEVWGTELQILNQLTGLSLQDGDALTDLVAPIRNIVQRRDIASKPTKRKSKKQHQPDELGVIVEA